MRRAPYTSAIVFVACIVGSLYTAMMLGCYVHEVLGHGLIAVALGGTLHEFVVDPAAHGWANYTGVPDRLEWAPLWAGMGVNLICGLTAIAATRVRSWRSGHAGLALLAIGMTHTGQAIGYSLQGAISGRGDAAALQTQLDGWPRAIAVASLAGAYALLLDWAMRLLAHLIDEQFAPPSPQTRRRRFLGTVLLPFTALMLARPASKVFSPAADWGSRAALLFVVGAWGWWRCGAPAPVPGSTAPRPLHWRGALTWILAAITLAVAAAAWSSSGVSVEWGAG